MSRDADVYAVQQNGDEAEVWDVKDILEVRPYPRGGTRELQPCACYTGYQPEAALRVI